MFMLGRGKRRPRPENNACLPNEAPLGAEQRSRED
ncbi:hypothetical protein PAESOLCIP111_00648 [Paenibacillus solanacearum]|uniref:Uncharacterized protein n=1 Tax=Paenibacillus solanacearum TaxID=2048548 RepID=A0A916NV82_9BACL|nr:hypothetical protein PAESOLCIP111_00648 [Paenibacillus solanacearum]